MKIVKFLLLFMLAVSLYNCSGLELAPADFSWPIESVLEVNDDGMVQDERYSFSVNVDPLFISEAGEDTSNVQYSPVRIIRDKEGYYFLTSKNFKNVYVFFVKDGKMLMENKIQIKESGLQSPVFNQRSPNIELVDGKNMPVYLNKEGIVEGDQQ